MERGFKIKYLIILFFFQQSVTLPELPAVVVFKDGGYFTYDGECCYPVFIHFCFGTVFK